MKCFGKSPNKKKFGMQHESARETYVQAVAFVPDSSLLISRLLCREYCMGSSVTGAGAAGIYEESW